MTKHVKKSKPFMPAVLALLSMIILGVAIVLLLRGKDVILFNPKGVIAEQQMKLMITATLVMLEIAIPTILLLYYFAWKYRETNEKATYDPEPRKGKYFIFTIWALPIITVIMIAVLLIPATHKYEPQKPVDGATDPLRIQVVAMRWKWLFIYPDQNIATVNYVQIPVHTPVQFELTADETPMSSFWIPHLGGMLYAMTEHVNRLNLRADMVGDFEGSAAEINGHGFAGMRFNTRVSTQVEFEKWVQETKVASSKLDTSAYQSLLEPSENHPAAYYANPDPELYSNILSKYASGGHSHETEFTEHQGGHE